MYRAQWERMSDATVLRHSQLLEILPRTDARDSREAYEYATAIRRELNRRKLVRQSIAILKCESCSRSTERLFEATQKTHPGLANRSDTPVGSAWFCARCWSGDDVDED
jgi:hypothetical protein